MADFAELRVTLDDEAARRVRAEAAEMGLPEEGVLMMSLLEASIRNGTVADEGLMSAQEHIGAMADKIEANGVAEDELGDLVAKLRILSLYATTQVVPVDPY